MSLPVGFLELAEPAWVDDGRVFATTNRKDPENPIFLRGSLRILGAGGLQHGVNPPPRWAIYAGPMRNRDFDAADQIIRDWAWRSSTTGARYVVDTEPVFIAPHGLLDSRWPRFDFRWTWQNEQQWPNLYQARTTGGAAGNPRGNFVRVR